MIVQISQIMLCVFIIFACVYSIIGENKRNNQMNEIVKRLHE